MKLMVLILVFSCQNSREQILGLKDDDNSLKISYIGNMGVLIENKHKTVLIDGFHKKYKPAYVHPSEGIVDSLVYGNYQGFTKLELSLVTHKHKDHFSPGLTLHFLRKNKESLTIGPAQVKEELAKAKIDGDKVLERVKIIDSDYINHTIQHRGIHIKSIKCDHTYQEKHRKIQNIAYLIDLNGFKILHVGDSDWDLFKVAFDELNLVESNIDVAILPFWMLIEETSKTKVKELINPNMMLASHIDPNFAHQVVEEIHVSFPDVVCLTELYKTIKFKKRR